MSIHKIAPQPGPQEMFLASPADIVIYGGAAGGGKSYALLLEGIRHSDNSKFSATIFRKNANQIMAAGGLWDTASELYPHLGAKPSRNPRPTWRFPSGAKVIFAHLEYEKDKLAWQGSQICYLGFDELTHFTEGQFFYMLSRNRSSCGVRPYVRATTNPDVDSWVATFISWWINQDTGYPIPERSGAIRYMARYNNVIYWGDTPSDVVEQLGGELTEEQCKSVTFISSKLSDNQILMKADPGYIGNLKALPEVEKERLLNGNWKIKPAAGKYFKRALVTIIPEVPKDVTHWVRGWDLAATSAEENSNADRTAGVLIGKRSNGRYVIASVINSLYSANEVRSAIKNTGRSDNAVFKNVKIRLPQDPGQAGKAQAASFVRFLAGFRVVTKLESGSKEVRAEPFSVQWLNGNVDIVAGGWNEEYLSQMESFPESAHDDMVDASSSAFNELEIENTTTAPGYIPKESYWSNGFEGGDFF